MKYNNILFAYIYIVVCDLLILEMQKAIYSPNNKVPRFLVAVVQKYVILNLLYVSKHRTSELLEFVGTK